MFLQSLLKLQSQSLLFKTWLTKLLVLILQRWQFRWCMSQISSKKSTINESGPRSRIPMGTFTSFPFGSLIVSNPLKRVKSTLWDSWGWLTFPKTVILRICQPLREQSSVNPIQRSWKSWRRLSSNQMMLLEQLSVSLMWDTSNLVHIVASV